MYPIPYNCIKKYVYNAWGQRTLRETRTNALTLKESRSYDKFGRLERIESGNDVVKYEYNSQNQLTRRTANNIPVYYTYTPQGQLETKSLGGIFTGDKAIGSLQYFYSLSGQIIARSVNGKKQEYRYDKRGQLLEVIGSEKYTYDSAGNILKKTINGVTTTFSYDAANQLVTGTKDGQTTNYQYDAAGRLVNEGDKTYVYGHLDKIMKVMENGQTTATFDYHVNGQLASIKRNNQSENFLWDNLALIHRGETFLINEPAATGGNPILVGGHPLLEDMLGTSLGTLKSDNLESNELTAFGEPINVTSDSFFTGKPYVGELGYVFLFRNYRPEKGKWQTKDPLGYPDGWNNFAYVNNWVIKAVDPFGEEIQIIGTSEFREAVIAALDTIRDTYTGEQIIQDLIDSDNVHLINEQSANGIVVASSSENGIGSGSIIDYNPNLTQVDGWNRDTWVGLAHEIVHAWEADSGSMSREKYEDTNISISEVNACMETNRILLENDPNATTRTMYGKDKLPDEAINPEPIVKPE